MFNPNRRTATVFCVWMVSVNGECQKGQSGDQPENIPSFLSTLPLYSTGGRESESGERTDVAKCWLLLPPQNGVG